MKWRNSRLRKWCPTETFTTQERCLVFIDNLVIDNRNAALWVTCTYIIHMYACTSIFLLHAYTKVKYLFSISYRWTLTSMPLLVWTRNICFVSLRRRSGVLQMRLWWTAKERGSHFPRLVVLHIPSLLSKTLKMVLAVFCCYFVAIQEAEIGLLWLECWHTGCTCGMYKHCCDVAVQCECCNFYLFIIRIAIPFTASINSTQSTIQLVCYRLSIVLIDIVFTLPVPLLLSFPHPTHTNCMYV